MALSNADNPLADKPRKAAKVTPEPAPAPAPEPVAPPEPEPAPVAPAPRLAKAAASSNPIVQHLLAERFAASTPQALARIDAELAALGFAV